MVFDFPNSVSFADLFLLYEIILAVIKLVYDDFRPKNIFIFSSNHKAMLLLNHLRNSTREDIRNPVKNVLNYLNSFNVSGVYVPASPHPSVPDTPQLSHRFDGNLRL